MQRIRLCFVLLPLCLLPTGCWSSSGPEVIVYAALDAEFSQPILDDFTAKTGIKVRPKFDVESTKTVGLAKDILAEAGQPRCDVFWNNEILNTLLLQRQGLLETYRPLMAQDYPRTVRSPKGTWHGFAARARVLIINTQKLPEGNRPSSILDLAQRRWIGQAGIAKPLFGTTATHAACLFAYWGEHEAKDFFRKVKANQVSIESGNKQVALKVASGALAFGLTDTDDAIVEKENGKPVAIIYPDQGPDGIGTLFIPNTLAIVRGGPNADNARRLVDYLLSAEVEAKLAAGRSAQIPLNRKVNGQVRVETPQTITAMQIDFEAAAENWETAREFIRDEFTVE